jgi:hypothetical protein
MNTKVSLKEFIESYTESLGVEGAEQLMKKTTQKLGLSHQKEFNKEEALRICRELKQFSGFIGIIGSILNSRIIIR